MRAGRAADRNRRLRRAGSGRVRPGPARPATASASPTDRATLPAVATWHLLLPVGNLSFRVEPGKVTGFLGPNGAGKSTTMRLMLGLDAGEGETLFDGVPYRELAEPARRVGAMLVARSFHPARTAVNHLRMLAKGAGLPVTRAAAVAGDQAGRRGRLHHSDTPAGRTEERGARYHGRL
ncbi:ATP-binding cassette domain-containing protein [Streptomyces bacillaris]|uniref:ATP-binding cassette domain-containing protein n=1 Tax=Streptomyces bacillaris TaxID=68179 RepID=UPI003F4CFB6A